MAVGAAVLAIGASACSSGDAPFVEPATRVPQVGESAWQDARDANPKLADVQAAVTAGDVDRLLDLVNWREETCGIRRDVACGDAGEGARVTVVNAGFPVAFYVPDEILRPSLEQVLRGQPLELRFASQVQENPSIFLLGFDGIEAKGSGLLPLADPTSQITGLFLTLDVSESSPITQIEQVTSDYSATKRGSEPGVGQHRLILSFPLDSTPPALD